MKRQINVLVVAAAMACIGQAVAQTTTWTLKTPAYGGTGTISSQRVFSALGTDGATTATITGYANTAAGGGLEKQLQTGTDGVGIHSYSGGIGLKNADHCTSGSGCDLNEGTNPEHAFDNNERFDFALVDFGSREVNLTHVSAGWFDTDADITVLAYTGSGDPTLDGSSLSSLPSGWQVIGNYAELQNRSGYTANITAQTQPTSNPTTWIYSSLWLIGAFSPDVGGACYDVDSYGGCGAKSLDHVKFDWIKGYARTPDEGSAPEPGSLALFGLALGGLLLASRRRLA